MGVRRWSATVSGAPSGVAAKPGCLSERVSSQLSRHKDWGSGVTRVSQCPGRSPGSEHADAHRPPPHPGHASRVRRPVGARCGGHRLERRARRSHRPHHRAAGACGPRRRAVGEREAHRAGHRPRCHAGDGAVLRDGEQPARTGRGQRRPAAGPDGARLPRGQHRRLRDRGGVGRSGATLPPDPRGARPGGRPDQLRGDEPGGEAARHGAAEWALRHRRTGRQLRQRALRPGPGVDRAEGGRRGGRSGCPDLARAGPVSRRRVDGTRHRDHPVQRGSGAGQRTGHEHHRARRAGPRRARRLVIVRGCRRGGVPRDRAERGRGVGLRTQRGGQPAEQ